MVLPLFAAVCRGRLARILFEKLAEKRLVGKVQFVGDLLNAHRRGLQQPFGGHGHKVGNQFVSRLVAHLLDDRRKVFGRYAHLVGVEVDRALLLVILLEQREKFPQNIFLPRYFGAVALLPGGEYSVQLQRKGRENEAYDDGLCICFVATFQQVQVLRHHQSLVERKLGVGMLGDVGAEREYRIEVDKGVPLLGRSPLDRKIVRLEIAARRKRAPHRVGIDEREAARCEHIVGKIDLQLFAPPGTQDNGKLVGCYAEVGIVVGDKLIERDGNEVLLLKRIVIRINRVLSCLHINRSYSN